MQILKKIISLTVIITSSFFLLNAADINVGYLTGTRCIPVAALIERASYPELDFFSFQDSSSLINQFNEETVDVGFLPVMEAYDAYLKSDGKIIMCAITQNGNAAVVSRKKIKSINNLENCYIMIPRKIAGTSENYIFDYLSHEIFVFSNIENSEEIIISKLISGSVSYALLCEPYISLAKKRSADFMSYEISKDYTHNAIRPNYPVMVMVVRREFASKNPEILASFIKQYRKAFEWTYANRDKVYQLIEKYGFQVSKSELDGTNIIDTFTSIPTVHEGNVTVAKDITGNFFKACLVVNPTFFGGKIPNDDFYYGTSFKNN